MTTTTDLSRERLDELEQEMAENHDKERWPFRAFTSISYSHALALIAMAKRTEQAERERDALRDVLGLIAGDDPACGCDAREMAIAALAQPTTEGGSEMVKAGRYEGWYAALTEAQLKGRQVITRVPIRCRAYSLPAGATLTIARKFSGLDLEGLPCEHCGVRIYVRRVPPWDVDLVPDAGVREPVEATDD